MRRNQQQDFSHVLEDLPEAGGWVWDTGRADGIAWSTGMYRIFGVPSHTQPSMELIFERIHPDDRSLVARFLEGAQSGLAVDQLSIEYRLIRPDGEIRWVIGRVTPEPDGDGGVRRMRGAVQDVTEQRRAEQEIRAYSAVTEALADWGDFDASARVLLEGLARPMGWKVGGIWHAGQDEALTCRVMWTNSELDGCDFAKRTAEMRLSPQQGIPGTVWWQRTAANVEDLSTHPDFLRRAEAAVAGLRSAFAFPALAEDEPLAVFEFYGPEPGRLTHRLAETLAGIGRQIGAFLARHRAELDGLRLSQREREVLGLAAAGRTTAAIAEELYISPATVKTHFERISKRLDVHDRTAAVATALRQGLIS